VRPSPKLSGLLQTSPAERAVYSRVTEDDVDREVRRLAGLYGWRHYHTRYSLRSQAGFPDVALLRPPRFILAELKRQGGVPTVARLVHDRRGYPRWVEGQLDWLADLTECPGVEAYLWWPDTLGEVATILESGPRVDMVCVRRLQELVSTAGKERTADGDV
jgi:hypothetical protein